jgi:hypothetical protein
VDLLQLILFLESALKKPILSIMISWAFAFPLALAGTSSEAQSCSPTCPPVVVIGNPGGGWGGWGGSGGWGGGGGGGGWGGNSTGGGDDGGGYGDDGVCTVISDTNEPGCDLANPPQYAENGCTGSPDGMPGAPGLFNNACNRHDFCYGMTARDKADCDQSLGSDMVMACDSRWLIGGVMNWLQWEDCNARATIYSGALLTNIISSSFFEDARFEFRCRTRANEYSGAGC